MVSQLLETALCPADQATSMAGFKGKVTETDIDLPIHTFSIIFN